MKQEKIVGTVGLISALVVLVCEIIGQIQSDKGFHFSPFYFTMPLVIIFSVMLIRGKPN